MTCQRVAQALSVEPSRRQLLELLLSGMGLAVGARLLAGCREPEPPSPSPDEAPSNFQVFSATFEAYPALREVGGVQPIDDQALFLTVLTIREDTDTMVSLWRICPHGACEVQYRPDERVLECPCHGSRFGLDGALLQGPATRGLSVYATRFDETHFYITSHLAV